MPQQHWRSSDCPADPLALAVKCPMAGSIYDGSYPITTLPNEIQWMLNAFNDFRWAVAGNCMQLKQQKNSCQTNTIHCSNLSNCWWKGSHNTLVGQSGPIQKSKMRQFIEWSVIYCICLMAFKCMFCFVFLDFLEFCWSKAIPKVKLPVHHLCNWCGDLDNASADKNVQLLGNQCRKT